MWSGHPCLARPRITAHDTESTYMTVACPGRQQLRLLVVAGLVGLLFIGLTAVANAQSDDNATCLGCHSTAGLSVELASGEILPAHRGSLGVPGQRTCQPELHARATPTSRDIHIPRSLRATAARSSWNATSNARAAIRTSIRIRSIATMLVPGGWKSQCRDLHRLSRCSQCHAGQRAETEDLAYLRDMPQRHLRSVRHQRARRRLAGEQQPGRPHVH